MEKKQYIFFANLGLFFTAAIWGGGFIAGKVALAEYSPFTILFFRFSGAALLSGILFFPILRRSDRDTIKKGLLLGIVQFSGLSLQLAGLRLTTAGKQSFLIASYVVFVPLLAFVLLRKPLKKVDLAAAILTLTGVGFMSLGSGFSIAPGDSLSIGFALVFAFQIVLTGIFARHNDPLQLSFFQFLSSAVLSGIAMTLSQQLPTACSLSTLYSLIYLVAANTVLAFTLQNLSQKYASETTAAILLSLESVFGFFFSVWLLKEPVTVRVLLGCALIFCAVLLSKIQSALHLAGKQSVSNPSVVKKAGNP